MAASAISESTHASTSVSNEPTYQSNSRSITISSMSQMRHNVSSASWLTFVSMQNMRWDEWNRFHRWLSLLFLYHSVISARSDLTRILCNSFSENLFNNLSRTLVDGLWALSLWRDPACFVHELYCTSSFWHLFTCINHIIFVPSSFVLSFVLIYVNHIQLDIVFDSQNVIWSSVTAFQLLYNITIYVTWASSPRDMIYS